MANRNGLALHWKILIGLLLGLVAGLVANLTWGERTWARFGVNHVESYLKHREYVPPEPRADAAVAAARWLGDALEAQGPVEPDLEALLRARTERALDEEPPRPPPDPEALLRELQTAALWIVFPMLPQELGTTPDPIDEQRRERIEASIRSKLDKVASDREAGQLGPTGFSRATDRAMPFVVEEVAERTSPRVLERAGPNERATLVAGAARIVRNAADYAGQLFIRSLMFIAVPIVLFSLIVGASSLNDLRKLGRIGAKTIVIYICTTALAITIGLTIANIVQPGTSRFVPPEVLAELAVEREAAAQVAAEAPNIWEFVLNIVPRNPFEALATMDMLSIVFFALVIGIALTLIPKDKAAPVILICDAMTDVVIKLVRIIMLTAPYAVFALVAVVIADMGLEILWALAAYASVVVAGLVIMAFAVYPAIFLSVTKGAMGYRRFFRGIAPAQLLAFSSSSSVATLPVTLECAQKRLGVEEEVSSFVLPLGATINMDGTALYQGVAAVFIAQLFGIQLDLQAQLTIVLTATLASIGTAGVPGAGVVMLVIVLGAVGMPPEVMTLGIAIILGVDRILDMCRTACNITGDAMVATVVASTEGELLSEEQVQRRLDEERARGLDEHPLEATEDQYGIEQKG